MLTAMRSAPTRWGDVYRAGLALVIGLLVAVASVACSNADEPTPAADSSTSPSAAPTSTVTSTEGLFDIGGRALYLTCAGAGQPTVVYLHGLGGSHANAGSIPRGLEQNARVCAYDRANVGRSDVQPEGHTAAGSVEDLHTLLQKAEVSGPYVLLGASFGGLLAVQYAGTYPEEVVGIVLLDAPLPGQELVDQLLPEDQRAALMAAGDQNAEKVDLLASLNESQAALGSLPDIPVTYLAARIPDLPQGWPEEAIAALIRQHQQAFVSRFSQGRFEVVDAPHAMEAVIPERIVAETQRVIELTQ
jgi:pimeloyl-ACP methyl ester carboxylesterase